LLRNDLLNALENKASTVHYSAAAYAFAICLKKKSPKCWQELCTRRGTSCHFNVCNFIESVVHVLNIFWSWQWTTKIIFHLSIYIYGKYNMNYRETRVILFWQQIENLCVSAFTGFVHIMLLPWFLGLRNPVFIWTWTCFTTQAICELDNKTIACCLFSANSGVFVYCSLL
jgi:hypothetical protein